MECVTYVLPSAEAPLVTIVVVQASVTEAVSKTHILFQYNKTAAEKTTAVQINMDFCYSGLKRGFRQIFFYFFYQFVAIEIFEDFDHASAYHRVHLETELYSADIGFEPVTPFT